MTLPLEWRRRRRPDGVVCHLEQVPADCQETLGTLPLTSAVRSLTDCLLRATLDPGRESADIEPLLRKAISRAVQRGLCTRATLRRLVTERRQLLPRATRARRGQRVARHPRRHQHRRARGQGEGGAHHLGQPQQLVGLQDGGMVDLAQGVQLGAEPCRVRRVHGLGHTPLATQRVAHAHHAAAAPRGQLGLERVAPREERPWTPLGTCQRS